MNQDPVALPDVFTTPENTPLVVTAPGHLANDFDLDGDPIEWLSYTVPSNGVMSGTMADGAFVYTPNPSFSGLEQLTYAIGDGEGGIAFGELLIYVGFVPPDVGECSATTLAEVEGQAASGAGEVTATFSNPDGIEAITFTLLQNFTVTAPGLTDAGGGRYETTGSPPSVTVTLTQADQTVAEAAYFAEVESVCPSEADGTLETDFDPPYDFETLPAIFAFEGNYPNPFRGQTTLRFDLPEAANVSLSIYDVMGRQVATLVDGSMAAGRHEVAWQGRGRNGSLASGVYFARLKAGTHTATRRLTIVR
jgi:hypothetical protein